jgi:simple sugar transport system ATP-binding protein
VLRNGRLVGSAPIGETPPLKLISLMIGRELGQAERRLAGEGGPPADAPVMLQAEGVGRKLTMQPFDLMLRGGEVVGLSGLLGSGRTETAKLVFGAIKPDSGKLQVVGAPMTGHSPSRSIRAGVAFCPEDRKAEGSFGELTVRENIVMALQSKRGWLRLLSRGEQEKLADQMIKTLAISTPDAEKPVGQLSGGNQQKVLLARSLVSGPRVLILDEPTRGIDVGAHAEIVTLIRKLSGQGLALLVASSELDELVAVSDRVAVLRDRHKIGEISGADITRDNVIHMIAGTQS